MFKTVNKKILVFCGFIEKLSTSKVLKNCGKSDFQCEIVECNGESNNKINCDFFYQFLIGILWN